jgi:hypothetical protein
LEEGLSRKGSWRLYTNPRLDGFLEIREEDIVHTAQLGSEDTPFRGTAVWIKVGAQLVRTRTNTQQSQADFLSGDITGRFLAATRGRGELGDWTWTVILTTLTCVIIVSTVCTVNCETVDASSGTNSCCICG